MKHIVYGNGESRPKDKIIGGEWVTTWGCNAIYRDFTVDNLVSVDYNIQQEIYESEYALTNKCWFSDWSVLPDFDTAMILMENDGPVYETLQLARRSCVVQGKTIDSVQRVMDEILTFNPQCILFTCLIYSDLGFLATTPGFVLLPILLYDLYAFRYCLNTLK